MRLYDILNEHDCDCYETVYLADDGEVLSEAAIRQFKRVGQTIVRRYRCLSGPKKGKLVSSASACSQRKDPKKVRQGRKTMRTKAGVIKRKSQVSKKKAMSKLVTKMNKQLTRESTLSHILIKEDKILYVHDSTQSKVVELNTSNQLEMQRFNNKYKFHSDSLYDIPLSKGVRMFDVNGKHVMVSDNPTALAAAVEDHNK
jgi:hypothetical protein